MRDPANLAYASHADVKPLIGQNPFEKSEEELIKEFNSEKSTPLVLFLGLDERKKDGFEHGIYKGTPFFAIDVTPKGSIVEAANALIESQKAKGFSFIEGRMHMSLNAPEGTHIPPSDTIPKACLTRSSGDLRPRSRPARLERPKPLLRWLWPAHHVYQRWH